MKYIRETDMKPMGGKIIGPSETFTFRCHAGLACFNQCCHNLNLFLYPYDVLRLKRCLGISSDRFIDQCVDIVLRDGHHFPEVVLRMADSQGQPCVFLTPDGCRVYAHRPHTCRLFPMEQAARYEAATGQTTPVHIFRPPDFCLGPGEARAWTVDAYTRDQGAGNYYAMTLEWAQLRRLFESNPWGAEGPGGAKGKMAFMAAYNVDRFRDFVFQSSFLKRYKVASALIAKMRGDDTAMMLFGFEWIKVFVWGMRSSRLRPK